MNGIVLMETQLPYTVLVRRKENGTDGGGGEIMSFFRVHNSLCVFFSLCEILFVDVCARIARISFVQCHVSCIIKIYRTEIRNETILQNTRAKKEEEEEERMNFFMVSSLFICLRQSARWRRSEAERTTAKTTRKSFKLKWNGNLSAKTKTFTCRFVGGWAAYLRHFERRVCVA